MSNECEKTKTLGNYEMGYCRPPKHSQWKSGQSGNPGGGSKKNINDLVGCVANLLNEKIVVLRNGKNKRITKRQYLAEKLYFDSMSVGGSARRELIALDREHAARLSMLEPLEDVPFTFTLKLEEDAPKPDRMEDSRDGNPTAPE